ncbi:MULTISPECIES: ribonucleoside-diphosphate reductase [unclassified Halomonas]|uniref:ribonucleoside-diphosphate reductase n=1 Tax=unclassified Halomonas TaxID=2609666 RepID=UPI0006D9ABA6|nr:MULTISPECIES: ribonucleoside-diphosphate reductase [unclassified Halomonas]KPQ18795.1 MAG: class II B12-dependent ribonucleotide reductase beta subunit NrdJb [Halomonas sp. HL-93]SBR52289.1 ribonucleoside-diphosphate reductase alpha chain [Halomonas sp. HL-93]SNY98083.1 ribonucleoside-diphosphate reductase alpha chain [Halomonas sp. hl-4]
MTVEITSKIVGYRIKQQEQAVPVRELPEEDPLTVRIPSRPEGTLEAVSEKISYVGAEGRKKVYLLVSFMPVEGVVGGKRVVIERPVEFFFPSGQLSSEHQWITATMRSLSLAARGGYVTQAVADLRKVAWDKGLVRCGMNRWNKPMFHDSEVAAIAWSIQQILYRRGFLDQDGNQVPVENLVERYAHRMQHGHAWQPPVDEAPEEAASSAVEPIGKGNASTNTKGSGPATVGHCPECRGELIMMDGCPTCYAGCGWSKCG